VGLIAHEMLWGAHPFVEDLSSYDPHALISRQFFESPPSLAEVGVPEPMARVVARALSKDPETRQQDGLSFAEDVWAAWERMREAAPELDTLGSETALEPGAGRAASFGELPDAVTKRLPVRGTAGRARTVRLPEAERDPSCVEALSARKEAAREATEVSSPPEWSEVRVRVPEGTRFDTLTLPAARPLEGRSGAEPRLEAPVVVVTQRGHGAAGSSPTALQGAREAIGSAPRSAGRRGRGLRVAERVGMLLFGLLAGMVLRSMVSVHGEEAREKPGEPQASAQDPAPQAHPAASPQPQPSAKAPEPVPEATEARKAPPAARSVPEALPTNTKTNTNTNTSAGVKPTSTPRPRPAPAPPRPKRIFELIE
jgi:hypothetical protein